MFMKLSTYNEPYDRQINDCNQFSYKHALRDMHVPTHTTGERLSLYFIDHLGANTLVFAGASHIILTNFPGRKIKKFNRFLAPFLMGRGQKCSISIGIVYHLQLQEVLN